MDNPIKTMYSLVTADSLEFFETFYKERRNRYFLRVFWFLFLLLKLKDGFFDYSGTQSVNYIHHVLPVWYRFGQVLNDLVGIWLALDALPYHLFTKLFVPSNSLTLRKINKSLRNVIHPFHIRKRQQKLLLGQNIGYKLGSHLFLEWAVHLQFIDKEVIHHVFVGDPL